jgi:hypothetical protein
MPNRMEKATAAAKFGKYTHNALHASAGTYPSRPGVAYELKPGVQVLGGRLNEKDGMDGFAIDTVGRSNERGGILGSKLPSRREGGAVAEGSEVVTARVESAGEGVGVGEAVERRGSSRARRSGRENLIA